MNTITNNNYSTYRNSLRLSRYLEQSLRVREENPQRFLHREMQGLSLKNSLVSLWQTLDKLKSNLDK